MTLMTPLTGFEHDSASMPLRRSGPVVGHKSLPSISSHCGSVSAAEIRPSPIHHLPHMDRQWRVQLSTQLFVELSCSAVGSMGRSD